MKDFATLIVEIDQTNKTNNKVEAIEKYFHIAQPEDKLWAIALLSGRRPRSIVNTTRLRDWAQEASGISSWLFDESYSVTGDLSETIALLLEQKNQTQEKSLIYWMEHLESIRKENEEKKKEIILADWHSLSYYERFIYNKLLMGGFRIGVSQQLVVKALAKVTKLEVNVVSHRMMGHWDPFTDSFNDLFSESATHDISRPYPFYLAYALEQDLSALGEVSEWQAEWKWDGIRGQLIKREGEIFLWSRGEDLITEKFPEFLKLAEIIPDGTVLDGEILPVKNEKILSFNELQTRIGRKNLSSKILADLPIALLAYDLLEFKGEDIRDKPFSERRKILEQLVSEIKKDEIVFTVAPIRFRSWEELIHQRTLSREMNSEGLMLKRLNSPYETGRKKGNWWKWKVDPFTMDAVLVYAQRGHGRRANLYTDYTFAVWDNGVLVPVAKAYSGLTDKEILEVDSFIKKNTKEKFGPVRSVTPELVFELAFEGINSSPRHKSGIAVRFPRISRWRKDKPASEADTLDNLKALLKKHGS